MENNETEARLIELVRENESIWNKKMDTYKNKVIKDKCWMSIGGKLDLSGEDCEKLWKSLRAQYLAHQRKLKKPSGSGATARPYFRHELAMEFLRDGCDSDRTFSNVGENRIEDFENENESEVDFTNESVIEIRDSEPLTKSRNKTKKPRFDKIEEELVRTIKSDEIQDEFEIFGKLVAAKLRYVAGNNRKLFCETQALINTLLNEAEMEVLKNN